MSEPEESADSSSWPRDLPLEVMEWTKWHDRFRNESDRGAVLIGVSYIEEWLRRHLSAAMVANLGEKEMDALFDNHGALATLSARIELSFALGLIGDRMRRQLTLLRKIRNDFAHDFTDLSLSKDPIRNRVRELSQTFPDEITRLMTDRQWFEAAVLSTFMWFQSMSRLVRRMEWIRIDSFDTAELNETDEKEWIARVRRIQSGQEKPPRSWYSA